MSIQFNPLPTEVFNEEARPYIARLNQELRDLFALEGVLRNPLRTQRSDNTVVRKSEVQVDISRITPDIASVVSGSSTVVGVPALVFGLTNAAGTTTSAVATNSSIALFGTQAPVGYSTSGAVGTSSFAARADFRLPFPEALGTLADRSKTMTLTDNGSGGRLGFSTAFSAGQVEIGIPGAGSFLLEDNGTIASFIANSLVPGDLRIYADPNGSPVSVNSRGHLGTAGTIANDNVVLTFQDILNDSVLDVGISAVLLNSGTGGARGFNLSVSNSGANAVATIGQSASVIVSGASTTGTAVVYQAGMVVTSTANRSTLDGFNLSAVTLTGTSTTTFRGYVFSSPTGGTQSNVNAFQCVSLSTGATRRGFFVQAASGGTASLVIGLDVATLVSGVTRYAVRTVEQIVCTGSDIGTTTAGKGHYVKDANDGNFYRIGTSAGAVFLTNLGTTAPLS